MTSIEESLLKIADKVDPDNKVEVSPNNLNPNYSIQRSLERIADSDLSGGGSGGAGYTVETKAVAVVPEQSVETKGRGDTYVASLTLDTITEAPQSMTVTFQGQEYECEKREDEAGYRYGGNPLDFSAYPFSVLLREGDDGTITRGSIYTESAGTYQVKATTQATVVVPSEEFILASKQGVGALICYMVRDSIDRSWNEIHDAFKSGRPVMIEDRIGTIYPLMGVGNDLSDGYFIRVIGEGDNGLMIASFVTKDPDADNSLVYEENSTGN